MWAAQAGKAFDPDTAWKELQDGNKRYVVGRLRHPNQSKARRAELAQGQHPFAVILSCADSRLPPEVVFDQGLGDLFVVRMAGNVAPDGVIASIEFAVAKVGSKLIVVLGHERCAAVAGAMQGGPAEGHLGVLLDRIKPAVEATKGQPGDPLDNAVRANVRNVVNQLKTTGPILSEKIRNGGVKVIGARYDLATGLIEEL